MRVKTQNLLDHMSEAELIFTALAELSTRQIAKRARLELEAKTGRKVMTGENYLPPGGAKKKIGSER